MNVSKWFPLRQKNAATASSPCLHEERVSVCLYDVEPPSINNFFLSKRRKKIFKTSIFEVYIDSAAVRSFSFISRIPRVPFSGRSPAASFRKEKPWLIISLSHSERGSRSARFLCSCSRIDITRFTILGFNKEQRWVWSKKKRRRKTRKTI